MSVVQKGAIAFGLVYIPVNLYTAIQDVDVKFNQLHSEDKQRIRYKKVCGHCGKEVTSADIIKGFEYDKDKYVVVTDEDFEKIKTEKDKSIQILHFTNLGQISPVYYDKTYQIIPDSGGEKAFELLRSAMMSQQKIALGKTVMGTKQILLAIIPREDGMLLQTMFYEEEIKDLQKPISRPEVSDAELNMAKTLISSMDKPFDPVLYKDEYQEKLKTLIGQKIEGKEIVAAKPEAGGNVINLMDALKASIEQTQKGA